MNPETKGAVRTILAGLGGVGIAKGWYDAEQLDVFIGAIEGVVGGLILLGTLYWSIQAKRASSKEAGQVAAKVIKDADLENPMRVGQG